jgi:outer membrane protein OmpA-like peptidoglycan-associated protein
VKLNRILASCSAALLFTSGCSALLGETDDLQNDDGSPTDTRCAALLADPKSDSEIAGTTVLLADGSASSLAKTDPPAGRQDWASVLGEQLPENGEDLVVMGLFGGDVDWRLEKITPGKSNDENRTRNDLADTRACLTADLAEATAVPPEKPQTDVLRALAESADKIRDREGPKNIYLATDGLSNTGCADMRAAPIGDLTAIPDIVVACEPELPALDDTYTVQFLGIGNPADGWADVKTPQRTWMRELWAALCEATGANCPEPGSAAPDSIDADGVEPLEDADVTMPEINKTEGNPTVISVPSSLLFNVDEYSIAGDRSADALQEILDFLDTLDYTRIEVVGHTDSTGTAEHNRTLSEQRAGAVADYLAGEGFEDITTAGRASSEPACEPEFVDGEPDPVAMACNRRVEILVYT